MAGIYVNDEGTWKLPKSVWINQLGTWRVCRNVYANSGGAWKELIKSVNITSNQSTFNLYEYLGSPAQALSVIVNVSSGVEIFSSDTPYRNYQKRPPAFTVGNFATGSTVIINNNGYISGGGGWGGVGQQVGSNNSEVGGYGGDGIVKGSSNDFTVTIVNTGTIAGGGGGGGGGEAKYVCPPNPPNIYESGCGYTIGNTGGNGAGISGASRTQGGQPTVRAPAGQTGPVAGSQNNTAGNGGALGDDGQSVSGSIGGKAGVAIKDCEIAVSGNIIGAIT